MWEALIKLVEKWGCMHNFELQTSRDFEDSFYKETWTIDTYKCTKCGKFKKVKSR